MGVHAARGAQSGASTGAKARARQEGGRSERRSKRGWDAERRPFNASEILRLHGDQDFGEHEVLELHVSQRQLPPGKYYTALDVIDL